MKTVTEFSASVLASAAKFVKLPEPAGKGRPAAPAPAEGAPAEPPPAAAAEGAAPAEAPAAPVEAPAAPAEAPAAAAASVDEAGLTAALGIGGDRLARLVDALTVVGPLLGQVLKVRVLSGEETPPPGAKKVGDFYYVVDMVARPQRDDRRGGHGRGGPDERRGGRGGPGGAGRRPGGPGRDSGMFEREPPRGEVPARGAGWVLQRAPGEPGDRDRRGGPRGGRPGGGPGGGRPRGPGGGPGGRGPGGGPGGRGPGGGPGGRGPGGRGPGGGPGGGGPPKAP
jgi:hypothetical protein